MRHLPVSGLVRRWAQAVSSVPTGYNPMGMDEFQQFLESHLGALADRLLAESFDPACAKPIGASLVSAGLTEPEVLRVTLTVLGTPLREALAPFVPDPLRPSLDDRLHEAHAALAAGYAQALRERTLVEQEQIGAAVIAAHARVQRALRESEARFRAVFAGAAIGIGIADTDGRILQVNAALADLLGYRPAEMYRMNVLDMVHPDDFPGMWEHYAEMVRGERDHMRLDKPYYRKNGSVVWTHLTVSLLRDDAGLPKYTLAMMEDITDRRLLQERLRHQASHDPLTGLANRTMFANRLTEVIGNANPTEQVGLCYLDLDGFKRINDSLGHDVGDRLLIAVARRLRGCADRHGHLVARMGGDEFVFLVKNADDQQMVGLAEEVITELSRPVDAGNHRLRVSTSVGIVAQDAATTEPADLLKAADLTLYRAKAEGRGRWTRYDAAVNAAHLARFALLESLPDAIDNGEFTLVYQPLVSLGARRLSGVEALVRWHHPRLGLLGPDRFIGLAEETGAIAALGQWVMRESCRQASEWVREFPVHDFYVSVNVSAAQLRDGFLVDEVLAMLDESGLEPARLQLELTESAMMSTTGSPLMALRRLQSAGVRIAIDDFGTGYSNLAYLRSLPVTALKLAGQFAEGLRAADRDANDEQILRTLIDLAHVLGMTVTAEGVETAEQADRLRGLGCDAAQGWYLARAMAPEAITALLREGWPAAAG
jgi:diguanylate cyclase (GGDEF)-like protein/PAS domain S-box-containing protein